MGYCELAQYRKWEALHGPGLGATMAICISYPKSGRTWLRVMFEELGVPMSFTHLDTGHNSRSWGKPVHRIKRPSTTSDRVILLHRDPRDTVVSYFYETTVRQKPDMGRALLYRLQGRSAPATMTRLVKSPRFGVEKIIVFNLLCAEHLNALHVSYEALRADTVQQISKILAFIGHNIAEDRRIAAVVENNDFSRMQSREARGSYGRRELEARDLSNPNSFKVRRGKVGGWRDELDAEAQEFAHCMLEKHRYFERMGELGGRSRLALLA